MKKETKTEMKNFFGSAGFKKGSYSTLVIVFIVAIVVVLNFMVRKLPSDIASADISTTKIYTIGDVSKEVIKGLEHKVNIIVISDKDSVDTKIKTLLDKYDDYSDKIDVTYKDPALYPSVLTTYNTEADNIVVECKDTGKSTIVPFSDIILYDEQAAMYGYKIESEFDGEGQITTAIDHVTNDNNKTIYSLDGHNESSFGSSVTKAIKKSNLIIGENKVSLLTSGEIPEDCDVLIINQPTSDLSKDEVNSVSEYIKTGGNVIVLVSSQSEDTVNLNKLMDAYGISVLNGYAADGSRYNTYDQAQYSYFSIFPEYSTGKITGEYTDTNNSELALVRYSKALSVKAVDGVSTDEFLKTSSEGLLVTGENEYTKGTYTLAVKATDNVTNGSLTVYGCGSIIDESIVSGYSVINNEIFINSITTNFNDVSNISIPSVNIKQQQNTFSNTHMISVILIGLIPVALIVVGIIRWMRRRKL